MSASWILRLTSLSATLTSVHGYTALSFRQPGCQGDVMQTITEESNHCFGFDPAASSVGLVDGTGDTTWYFNGGANGFTSKNLVSSMIGNNCFTQGGTKIVGFSSVLRSEKKKEKREEAVGLERRQDEGYGELMAWSFTNTDCSGNPTDERYIEGLNFAEAVNNAASIMVQGVPDDDTAFACSDEECTVENEVTELNNGECTDVSGKNVKSVMVIGAYSKVKRSYSRQMLLSSIALSPRDDAYTCDTDNLADYTDALKGADDWISDGSDVFCCHIPGKTDTMTEGTATSSFSESYQCPDDRRGTTPSASCPLTCGNLRSQLYSIAAECKMEDDLTGGSWDDGLGVGHLIGVHRS